MLIPFIWMILTAFKSVTEATSVNPFVIFPKVWRTEAFTSVMENMNFLILYKNASDSVPRCLRGTDSYYGRLCFRTSAL